MHLDALLADLAIVFFAGVVAVLVVGRVGLPPVIGFLLAGLAIGPSAMGLVDDVHTIEVMAELGVALLLFTIGLEFSFDRLRRIGRYVVVGGGLQVGLTVLASVLGAWALGRSASEGVFWGYLAALSSTAIGLRLLADRGEVDAPHGRFVVGVLIFQDLCIVPMMLTMPLLAGEGASWGALGWALGQAAAVVVGVVLGARLVVPKLLGLAAGAGSRDVFVLTALLVATAVAWATASLGLSMALGAFLAGVVIAETEFVHQVASEVAPFRDALASLFFVSVGMLLDPAVAWAQPWTVLGLAALLIAGKLWVAVHAVMFMRFPGRVAMLSGLALAQVGEFSFVLLKAGEANGLASSEAARIFLASSVVTMIAAPLLVAFSPRLAAGAALLRPLERLLAVAADDAAEAADERLHDHVVVAGLGLAGRTLMRGLAEAGVPYVGVELDPDVVIRRRQEGFHVRYGDVTSAEVLEHVAHVGGARLVVLLLSDSEAARRAATVLRARYPALPLVARVHRLDRDGAAWRLPGVQLIAEDHEAAVEVLERVLRGVGAAGEVVAAAVGAARASRDPAGAPVVSATHVPAAFHARSITVAAGHAAVGRSLADLHLRARCGATVVALSRDGAVRGAPDPHDPLLAGDTLVLVGADEALERAARCLEG
jgi:CPA2 family monovalent cation:H+ antiporter-2